MVKLFNSTEEQDQGKSIEFIIGTLVFLPIACILLLAFAFSIYYSMQVKNQADYLYDNINFNSSFERFNGNVQDILIDISPDNIEKSKKYFLTLRDRLVTFKSHEYFRQVQEVITLIREYLANCETVHRLHEDTVGLMKTNERLDHMLLRIAPDSTILSHIYVANFKATDSLHNIIKTVKDLRKSTVPFENICSLGIDNHRPVCDVYWKHLQKLNEVESRALMLNDKFYMVHTQLLNDLVALHDSARNIYESSQENNMQVIDSITSIPSMIAVLNLIFFLVVVAYFLIFHRFFIVPIRNMALYIDARLRDSNDRDEAGELKYTKIREINDIIRLVKFTLSENVYSKKENLKLKKEYHKIYKISNYDALTGALNRRSLDEYIANLKEIPEGFAVLMADIDFFKKLNDTFGHQVGDIVLKQVSKALGVNLKATDRLYRYGGEEFCICLYDLDLEGLKSIAGRLNQAVSALKIPELKGVSVVTISLGASVITGKAITGISVNDFISQADEALYEAKRAGRNRYVLFQDLVKEGKAGKAQEKKELKKEEPKKEDSQIEEPQEPQQEANETAEETDQEMKDRA